ncbi:MAG TPA: formate dehydrogenase subunit gamma [Methylophilaceae bacterium]|nr:formate dehydrogenase subunit gamma [Methylophilaceae bacterium]
MTKTQKFLLLIVALLLVVAGSVRQYEEQSRVERDASTGATPFSLDEGRTAGVKSDAEIKAESGIAGITQSRIRDAGVFQQKEGQLWRTLRNGPVTYFGGWLLVLVPLLILGFYAIYGAMHLHGQPTGRLIQRFSVAERHVHWASAGTFVLLGLSGIVILFGKHLLLPLVGYQAFSWIAVIAKNLHNLAGPLFFVSVALLFRRYVKDNLWHKIDWLWIKDAHNVLRGETHVPSYKFNAAEKAWFWGGVTLLGLVVSLSGFVLDFPVFNQGRHVMQAANLIHGVCALLFICAAFGHVYMGTIGADGAFQAMKTGMVDETWAKEHHALWYEEEKVKQGLDK